MDEVRELVDHIINDNSAKYSVIIMRNNPSFEVRLHPLDSHTRDLFNKYKYDLCSICIDNIKC